MLRYALRRAIWILPALVVTTLLLFGVIARLARHGPPADDLPGAPTELPLFVNLQPRDVRALSMQAVGDIAEGRNAAAAEQLLVRLGGAALPFVLPQLDALGPDARGRLAIALQPVAERMGLASSSAFATPTKAVAFWTRFWEERAIDFKPSVVRRAVRRQAVHGSAARRAALLELDTYALSGLMAAVDRVETPDDVSRSARLLSVASHVTGREACVRPGMDVEQADRCVSRWREWWLVSRADFEEISGPERISAMLTETQYGLWALQALTLRLGVGPDGVTVLDRLVGDAPRTIGLALVALLLANGLAFPLALIGAQWRRGIVDHATAFVTLLLLSAPIPLVAVALAHLMGGTFAWAAAATAMIAGLITAPSRQQRLVAIDELGREWFRYGQACGIHPIRLLVVYVGRSSGALGIGLAALDFPLALSAACVVERAFGLRGLGSHLVRAVLERDVALLMAFGLSATVLHAVLLLLGDVATGWLDPRLRRAMHGERA
jgi:peptide/nickel transport system permease protein